MVESRWIWAVFWLVTTILLPWTASMQGPGFVPAPLVAGPAWEDVQAYGAKGDGGSDDTAAIQMAIDAVSSRGGGVVRLSQGTYLTSGSSILFLWVSSWPGLLLQTASR
jgi:hypothetical protein